MSLITIHKHKWPQGSVAQKQNLKAFDIPAAEVDIIRDFTNALNQCRRELDISYTHSEREHIEALRGELREMEIKYQDYIRQIYNTYVNDDEFNALKNPT
jgi:hypothetical protein